MPQTKRKNKKGGRRDRGDMKIRKGFTKKDYDKNGKLKKAVMIDACAVDYACPNNNKGEHRYIMHLSEKLTKKKIPKCPYCKTICEMIEWDNKTEAKKQK